MFGTYYQHLFRRAVRSKYPSTARPPKSPAYAVRSFTAYLAPTAAFAYFIYEEKPEVGSKKISYIFSVWPLSWSTERKKEIHNMSEPSKTVSPIAPGRPETLTKEEEAKLKEFWAVVLKVFGVANAEDAALTGGAGRNDKTVQQVAENFSAATISEDPKKKKDENKPRSKIGSLLRGSRKEKEQKESTTPPPAASNPVAAIAAIDDKDDKHGQAKDFKAALATQTPAELRQAFWDMVKSDNPDGLLLRFLRARKWDVEKALVMMVATMQWRANEMKVCPGDFLLPFVLRRDTHVEFRFLRWFTRARVGLLL